MNSIVSILAAAFVLLPSAPAQTGFPYTDESLHYTINWQSGLSLGDATMTAHRNDGNWSFAVSLSVGIPGFTINDHLRSATDSRMCSQEFQRNLNHAGKRSDEKTTFDQKMLSAHRVTIFPEGGGKTDFDVPACARDAVAFAYFARTELGQGRMPPAQQAYFGSPYSVRTDYTGAQNITVNNKVTVTDHLMVSVKGPKSDFNFEVFYARDPSRTPVQIRIPLSLGTFTLELVR